MATIAALSLWGQCLLGLLSYIKSQNVTGIPLAGAKIQKLPWNLAEIREGVFLHPVIDRITGRSNASDNWTFRSQLTWIRATNGEISDFKEIDEFLYGRQHLYAALLPSFGSKSKLPGLNFQYDLTVEPGYTFDPLAFAKGFDAQAFHIDISTFVVRQRPQTA